MAPADRGAETGIVAANTVEDISAANPMWCLSLLLPMYHDEDYSGAASLWCGGISEDTEGPGGLGYVLEGRQSSTVH